MPKYHHKNETISKIPHLMFSKTAIQPQGATQNVTVIIKIEKKEDGLVGCFKALLGCFKKSG